MSRENAELVRKFIEASRSGDQASGEAFVALTDASIEHTRLPAAFGPETYRGRDGIRRWFIDMAESWQEWRNEIEELVEVSADTVVAAIRFRGVAKESGVPVEARLGLVCVLSEGKVVRSRSYPSGEAAFEAEGAPKSDSLASE
jgi:ketosteroid isomerase-like protein